MAGITATGFEAKELVDIEDEIRADIWSTVSPSLNLEETTALGQKVSATARQLRLLWEEIQKLYAGLDPNQATGEMLRIGCTFSGVDPLPPQASTVDMTLDLDAGEYAAGNLQVSKVGTGQLTWSNRYKVVAPGGVVTGVAFQCESTGAEVANAATLTNIVTLVAGFNSATNPLAADVGRGEESAVALRARREAALGIQGSGNVDAVRADILAVADVDYASVLENPTGAVVDGIDPWSIRCIVQGGTDADIAAAIFASKAGGPGTTGVAFAVVTDEQNNDHTIYFDRPTAVPVECLVTYSWLSGTYADDTAANAAVSAALLAEFSSRQTVSKDVINSRYTTALMGLGTIVDVLVEWDYLGGAPAPQNLVIASTEYATLGAGAIAFAPTEVDGEP